MTTLNFKTRMVLVLVCALCFGVLSASAYTQEVTSQTTLWKSYQLPFKDDYITVIHPNVISADRARLEWVIQTADRSTVTSNPLENNTTGLVKAHDVFVVTSDMLLWFNCQSPASVFTNGGGGLLRALWTLHSDQTGNLNFKRITNQYNYAPSYLYAGSTPGVQGSGISLLGNFGMRNIDNGITFAIEHEHSPTITEITGTTIPKDVHAGGVFVQFEGFLANSSLNQTDLLKLGLQDHYDCDARADVAGRCKYTLTYRIASSGECFRQEITLNVTQNNFGPCATMVLSHNFAGYPNQAVSLVSDPQFERPDLNSDPNQYFAIKSQNLNFYTLPWSSHPGSNRWWQTPQGHGIWSGLGVPLAPQSVPFIVYRPIIEMLPLKIQKSYRLQAIDNQGASSSHRCLAMDLQLWTASPTTEPQTFPEGSIINVVTDYALHNP